MALAAIGNTCLSTVATEDDSQDQAMRVLLYLISKNSVHSTGAVPFKEALKFLMIWLTLLQNMFCNRRSVSTESELPQANNHEQRLSALLINELSS